MAKKKQEVVAPVESLVDFMTASIKKAKKEDMIQPLATMKLAKLPGCTMPSPQFHTLLPAQEGKIPYGSVLQLVGWESVGKSTLSWLILSSELTANPLSIGHFNDVERAGFGYKLAQDFRVDENRCWITQPPNGEQAIAETTRVLNIVGEYRNKPEIRELPEDKKPHAICILDCIPALYPKILIEQDPDAEKKKVQKAYLAALLSQTLSKFRTLVGETKSILILVNQYRMNFNMVNGQSWPEPCGGNATRFYSDVIMTMHRKSIEKVGEIEVGIRTKIALKKSRVCDPSNKIEVIFGWGNGPYELGIDLFNDLFVALKQRGARVQKKGDSWSTLTIPNGEQDLNEVKFQGLMGFKNKLLEDASLLDKCLTMCDMQKLSGMYHDKYKVMVTKAETLKQLSEDNITHQEGASEGEAPGTVKQMDDGGYVAPAAEKASDKMNKDASDVKVGNK